MGSRKGKGSPARQNAAFKIQDYHVNIVDTPPRPMFGREVERIMNMIDGVLLVVDAADGPQAQTRFVLARRRSRRPSRLCVINKIDRRMPTEKSARPLSSWFIFAQAHGRASLIFHSSIARPRMGLPKTDGNTFPDGWNLFDAIIKHHPPRRQGSDGFSGARRQSRLQ